MRAEIFKTRKQLLVRVPTFKVRYYYRLVGNNNEPLAISEAFTQKHNATEVLEKYFPTWPVKDLTGEK
jgi:hypothetical protein